VRQHILDANGREPLNSHYFSTHYPSIYAAAERIFGSWKGAIESAGLDYKKIRKYRIWTRTGVLQALKQMKKAGKSISCQAVQNSDKPLYMAAFNRAAEEGPMTEFEVVVNEPDIDGFCRSGKDGHGILCLFNRSGTEFVLKGSSHAGYANVENGNGLAVPPNACAMFIRKGKIVL